MKTQKPKLPKAERDRILTGAILRALNAMILLQGTRVTFGRKSGFIDFENEIFKLAHALQIMGHDVPTPVFHLDPAGSKPSSSLPRASRTRPS